MTDHIQRRVATILGTAAERAYDFPRRHDEGWDPELCVVCQRIRPVVGAAVCQPCKDGER